VGFHFDGPLVDARGHFLPGEVMLVYQVIYDRKAGRHRIRRRTVKVKKGQLCWPGPPALWPSQSRVCRRKQDALRLLVDLQAADDLDDGVGSPAIQATSQALPGVGAAMASGRQYRRHASLRR
jgi:hypothetical protein